MPETEQNSKSRLGVRIAAAVVTAVVLGLAIFFGVQLATGGGVFHRAGAIIFDQSASELDRDFINNNLSGIELKSDLTVGATESFTKLPDTDTRVLYDILVPVTDFYSAEISIPEAEAQQAHLVSIWDLKPTEKLLAIDNQYYLNSFSAGAIFRYYTLSGEPEDLAKVHQKLSASIATFPSTETVFTFAQTGVTALSRVMNTKLNQVGNGAYFAEKIGGFLSGFDKTHTSNESSFSAAAPSTPSGTVICSLPGMVDVLTSIGLDIVELTGNHNQDCGDQSAIATIDKYAELGIQTFGGGKTAAAAAIPLEISEKGANITLLGYNLSTGGYTLDGTPGANFYTTEKAQADIAAAKQRGDFIIVDVQFNECNAYASSYEDRTCDYANSSAPYAGYGSQVEFFRSIIDLGANMVVGTAAHQPQTFELYGDGVIYYGLGNLFFDQSWWPGTTRSLILAHYFYDGQLLQTRIVPTVYDKNFQTELMDDAAASQFIKRLVEARPGN